MAFNKNHVNWTRPDGTTRARDGVPLDSTASATRPSPTGNGREFGILDSTGKITARVWYIPTGDVLSAAEAGHCNGSCGHGQRDQQPCVFEPRFLKYTGNKWRRCRWLQRNQTAVLFHYLHPLDAWGSFTRPDQTLDSALD